MNSYAPMLLFFSMMQVCQSRYVKRIFIRQSDSYIRNLQEEKLSQVIKASGNDVDSYWPGLFAKALKGADIGDMLSNVGTAPAGGAGPAAAATAGGDAAPKEDKKEGKQQLLSHS